MLVLMPEGISEDACSTTAAPRGVSYDYTAVESFEIHSLQGSLIGQHNCH